MNIMIVLNFNDFETTNNYISQIKCYDVLDKIIVVDNCSTDNSYSLLKKLESEKVDIISTEKNNGYASGNNFGIKYAENYYNPTNIIISNPDIEVSEKSISRICSFLNTHKEIAAVSGLIHDKDNMVADNFAWKLPTYTSTLISTFISISKVFEKLFKITTKYNKNRLNNNVVNVDVLSGCFFAIKDKVLREVNYFDERTFLYNEESILAFKLRNKNYKQCVLTSEKIIHYEGVSINKSVKSWKSKNKILENSRKVYLKEYLKVSRLQMFIFILLFNIGKYEKFILLNLRGKFMTLKS
ncbi:glycosyltransferase family 2 protein [Metabacillus malikii]|uniref:GT2 family glycosyltransferase n=1 Tax=Metabacillus malikii TaxID=1504265 RepID=A0ABT9ZKD8_9BACI|nr:glycosyltransferase family 2 protein [Metabacillus malikii]MDQ0232756.1 GT2 family glycosyltransferase [Metabacillus malikii]